jgi:hypothetical protein
MAGTTKAKAMTTEWMSSRMLTSVRAA